VQETLEGPTYGRNTEMMVAIAELARETWMTPIKAYIEEGRLSDGPVEEKMIMQ